MHRSHVFAALLALVVALGSSADDRKDEVLRSISLEFQIKGAELRARVERVIGLGWHRSMAPAYAEARRSGKPILLVQALGTLDGVL